MSNMRTLAENSKAWPFIEARKIIERYENAPPEKGFVLFETGYGPSGLPHIGTFGEVARTTMVRHAFRQMSDLPTKLVAFSDDMDALRSVPTNVPGQEMLAAHLGMPLTSVPDPFDKYESFAHHNNAQLRAFLDQFEFEYEFYSATECYKTGIFDSTLLEILALHDEIRALVLPTLGEERQETYSPFLPICAHTGRVLQVPVIRTDPVHGTITYRDQTSEEIEVSVTEGNCKLQWKADWAMRWKTFAVDYEMSGKDLIPSLQLSSQICALLSANPPENLTYELFLDENAQKISKSRGNGLTIDEWLKYGPTSSLAYFMFQSPKKAKRLYFDVIPKNVDDYLHHLNRFQSEESEKRVDNPVWHIHSGNPPSNGSPLTFNLLLNLAGVCHAEDKEVLWGFISRYSPQSNPGTDPILDKLVGHALEYYNDFVAPKQNYRRPTGIEQKALKDLADSLSRLPPSSPSETIQTVIYDIGKKHNFTELRDWFRALYETLLGQSQGPRMGSFISLYGQEEMVELIHKVLSAENGKGLPKE